MKKFCGICLAVTLVLTFTLRLGGQKTSPPPQSSTPRQSSPPRQTPPLILTQTVPLPNVQGRFDHFGFDPKEPGRLFLSALGNNSVEVIDLVSSAREHSIPGIPHPQGVTYAPGLNKLFVASREGKLYIYDGTSFDLITAIDYKADIDNLRYDAASKRVYLGFGDGDDAAIGMVDATTNQRLDEEFKLGAHPESFQLETSGSKIYANLPDLKQIAVIDRATHKISRWPMTLEENFPMALDEANHRLFVMTRKPPRLAVFDTNSGKLVAALPSSADADDLYYDPNHKRVYIPGGQGSITVFQQKDPDHYELLAKIPTAVGARTAGYFAKMGKKGIDRLYLAVPASGKGGAEVRFYSVQD